MPDPVPQHYPLASDATSPGHKHQVRRAVIRSGLVEILDPGSHLVHDLAHRLEGLGAVDGVAAWMVDTLVSSAVGLPARLALLGVSTRMAQSTRRR